LTKSLSQSIHGTVRSAKCYVACTEEV
jgi:hypothetical protein